MLRLFRNVKTFFWVFRFFWNVKAFSDCTRFKPDLSELTTQKLNRQTLTHTSINTTLSRKSRLIHNNSKYLFLGPGSSTGGGPRPCAWTRDISILIQKSETESMSSPTTVQDDTLFLKKDSFPFLRKHILRVTKMFFFLFSENASYWREVLSFFISSEHVCVPRKTDMFPQAVYFQKSISANWKCTSFCLEISKTANPHKLQSTQTSRKSSAVQYASPTNSPHMPHPALPPPRPTPPSQHVGRCGGCLTMEGGSGWGKGGGACGKRWWVMCNVWRGRWFTKNCLKYSMHLGGFIVHELGLSFIFFRTAACVSLFQSSCFLPFYIKSQQIVA